MAVKQLLLLALIISSTMQAADAPFGDIPASLSISAGQSVRRNAGNNAFEAFTPGSGGGGTPGGSDKQLQYNNANAFGGIPSLTYDGAIPATITLDNLGVSETPVPALLITNTTPATSPTPGQKSAAIQWTAQSWNGTESQPVDFAIFGGGNGAPPLSGGDWNLKTRINNGAWTSALDFDLTTQIFYVFNEMDTFGLSSTNIADSLSGGSSLFLQAPIISDDFSSGTKFSTLFGLGNVTGLQATGSNVQTNFNIIPKGTVASTPTVFQFFGTDFVSDSTNYEMFAIFSKGSSDTYYTLGTFKGGSGTVRPINIEAVNSSSTPQLVIGTDGGVSVGTGTQAGSTNLLVAGDVTCANIAASNFPSIVTLTGEVSGSGASSITTTQTHFATFDVDGVGIVLSTGTKNPYKAKYGGTLVAWSAMCVPSTGGTCSVSFDLLRAANAAGLPTASMVGAGTKPAIASDVEASGTTFPSWTSTTITAGDNLAISLSGITTAKYAEITFWWK
jgi:hypothetical protein